MNFFLFFIFIKATHFYWDVYEGVSDVINNVSYCFFKKSIDLKDAIVICCFLLFFCCICPDA